MSEVRIPELAESITEATIVNWLKAEGDRVSQGEVLAELETDKVNVELSAEQDGTLTKILREPGDTVQVGEVVAIISQGAGNEEGTAASPDIEAVPADVKAASPDIEAVPADVKAASPVQTPAPAHVPSGIEANAAQPASTANAVRSAYGEEAGADTHGEGGRLATPAARRLARELNIDINQVRGQDPLGRITVEDFKANQTGQPQARQAKAPAAQNRQAGGKAASSGSFDKPVEHIPLTRRRKTIAERLVNAQHTAAMLTTFNEVDMTAIMDVRKRRQEKFVKEHNIKLGFMSFFTKAVVGALKFFPLLNAEIKEDEILVKKFYDIGIAVSTNEGLVVPVVRDADRLSFAGLEQAIAGLAEKARNKKLALSDLQGGTFTITNGGTFGSLLSTPILNAPQVGILGMHKIQLRPVAIDKEHSENRPMMYIALSYDHRIVDGKEAVGFLVKVKELLEDPETLLLEG
ncbi:2-oxoglutarate dehydrogenase complex dihydrolipoyllysine-residue succinyltransferase [Aneurinibacillus sp. Ricciae_BoGa-3]|uniref:2-oxoglutarate dehydrogenase complex dihydrolipoyllysine-residue succinyltransferase n=1 Tax=Aneurinibacillus sp. Ricciae_BoGa-3 TaxID=3022697 RepID=UPI002342682E|nr:2-oxoglutarate dehydrogenase complex dihydrolipoyllysine-residue succinyltransferase [Aneurinibacillus sp. Ricciae_BoGa-3]WCK54477.1 2-oxoglutarate dehydrogenase complex dihydrolipoyllysine-residue succinyltransferase [Aneurinibacillus sp. Ricciae_BoGa-3]